MSAMSASSTRTSRLGQGVEPRPARRTGWPALMLWLALASCPACFNLPDFASASLVDRPRILAVIADPPEVTVGKLTRLSILVAGAEQVSQVSWRACSLASQFVASTQYGENTDDRGCPEDEALIGMGPSVVWDPSALFRDDSAGLAALGGSLPPGVVEAIRAEVGIAFTVQAEVVADGKRLRALKRVLVSQNERAGTNPPPPQFHFGRRALRGAGDVAPYRCEPDSGSLVAMRGEQVRLDPVVDGVSAGAAEPWLEEYSVLDARGMLSRRTEQAFYSWFSSKGSIEHATTEAPDRSSSWQAPDEPGCVQLWLVVRDGHAGESACGFDVAVGDADACASIEQP